MNPERLRPLRTKRVLVIDDDRDLREMFRAALRLAGFDVCLASDGLSALAQLEHQPPAVVILDLDLPLVNGITVHAELMAREHMCTVPVVIVTGTEWVSPFPAFATLRKPISIDGLVAAVTKAAATVDSATYL